MRGSTVDAVASMTTGNGGARLWQLLIAVLAIMVGCIAWLLQREFETINARLDRITQYVLEHHGPDPEPH